MNKRPKVEFYKNAAGKWTWRLKAANGRIIAVPGEDFASKFNAEHSFIVAALAAKEAAIRNLEEING